MTEQISQADQDYRRFVESRLLGLRDNRYSWWTHWRELAEYELPRRYKWLVIPNQQNRGSPINQHILDSTSVMAGRNLASGLMSGKCSPAQPWVNLHLGKVDSTQTSPVSLWLAEAERLMHMVFQESNFYPQMAQFLYDLVIFGTASMIIYEDFLNVINVHNPCLGEFYVDIDGKYRPTILYREFIMSVEMVVTEFGLENCSTAVKTLWNLPGGSGLSRELIVAHAIEPNDDGRHFGIPDRFKFRECYWEWGGTASPQNDADRGFLRKRGYHEQPNITGRWDLVSNDPYGRSPGMDALPDCKQLQLETKRKAQAIDKMVNPPLVADVQLKNQPASLLPGGMTYVTGFAASGRPGIASVYESQFPVTEIVEDLNECRARIKATFYNELFQPMSQFETRSNVTAVEVQQRKAESLIMLGPVFERLDNEVLRPIVERTFAIMARAGIFPPAPPELAGKELNIRFSSMLEKAQNATQATSIQEVLSLVGELAGVDPGAMDNIDVDFALDNYSYLLGNDPRMIRSPQALAQIRANRAQQQQEQQKAQTAQLLSQGAATLSKADVGGGQNALQALTQGGGQ